MAVTVPEKTLEHWVSIFLSYRFKSWAAQWWPAAGEDIRVSDLPHRPGKAILLELKTATPTTSGGQMIDVDLGQLHNYMNSPQQPFYVFPAPNWKGPLEQYAASKGLPRSELAFQRSGAAWFGYWMRVLPAAEVARILQQKLAAHSSPKKKLAHLVEYRKGKPHWSPRGGGATWHEAVPAREWQDFWSRIRTCGTSTWPQTILVPRSLMQDRPLSYSTLRDALRDAKDLLGRQDERLEPSDLGPLSAYRISPSGSEPTEIDDDDKLIATGEQDDDSRRVVLYLDDRALNLS